MTLINDCGRPLTYVESHGDGTATYTNPTDPKDRGTYKVSPETIRALNGTRTSKQSAAHWEDAQQYRDTAIARAREQRQKQQEWEAQAIRIQQLQGETLTDAQTLRAIALIQATVGENAQIVNRGRTFVVMTTHPAQHLAQTTPIPYECEVLHSREVTRSLLDQKWRCVYTVAFDPTTLTPPEVTATYTREELQGWTRPELQRLVKQLHAQLEVEAQIHPQIGRHSFHTGRRANRDRLVQVILNLQEKLSQEVSPCVVA